MQKVLAKRLGFVSLSLLLLCSSVSVYSTERSNSTNRVASQVGVSVALDANDPVGLGVVPQLPADNLIFNPWFRTGTKPSLDGWVATSSGAGGWGASQKPGNPTPDAVTGTAARVSTGRGADHSGWSVDPGVDSFLSQMVSTDPQKRTLKFDMYWVTHTLNPGIVSVYGSTGPHGPWTKVWEPFRQVYTRMIIPSTGRGQDLWGYYSATTDLVTTTLERGYPYYKIEILANLPDANGGFKISGVYFAVE